MTAPEQERAGLIVLAARKGHATPLGRRANTLGNLICTLPAGLRHQVRRDRIADRLSKELGHALSSNQHITKENTHD